MKNEFNPLVHSLITSPYRDNEPTRKKSHHQRWMTGHCIREPTERSFRDVFLPFSVKANIILLINGFSFHHLSSHKVLARDILRLIKYQQT